MRDIMFSKEGDLVFDANDILIADRRETIIQTLVNRMLTNNPDWFGKYRIGADLEDLRGMDNNRQTAELGVLKIKKALTYKNRFDEEQIEVRAIPISGNEITFFIMVDIGIGEPITVKHTIEID